MYVESEDELREIYGHPKGRARDKQRPGLEPHSKNFIAHCFFGDLHLRQVGLGGLHARGGVPGFVKVIDDRRLLLPDGKGNNRLDSLVNIAESGRIGCLFLIPGVDETLRVNGRAHVSTSAEYLRRFSDAPNPPRACTEIEIEEVFFHCAKALMRSKLRSPESKIDRSTFPLMGRMINDQLSVSGEPEVQQDMIARDLRDL